MYGFAAADLDVAANVHAVPAQHLFQHAACSRSRFPQHEGLAFEVGETQCFSRRQRMAGNDME
jgi:hypothetical protein